MCKFQDIAAANCSADLSGRHPPDVRLPPSASDRGVAASFIRPNNRLVIFYHIYVRTPDRRTMRASRVGAVRARLDPTVYATVQPPHTCGGSMA